MNSLSLSVRAAGAVILAATLFRAGHAVELQPGFVDEAFVTGLPGLVTGFDRAPDGRLFIAQKDGTVRVASASGELASEAFVDISARVNDRVDRGLLGIAVHPNFPETPWVYVLYTYDPPELMALGLEGAGGSNGNGNRVARLERLVADASRDFAVAESGDGVILLGRNSTLDTIGDPEGGFDTSTPSCGPDGNPVADCLPIDELSHTIGSVQFAPDGSLYVTNGDGASYQNVSPLVTITQDIDSLRGKILRIDPVSGNAYDDNPWFDGDVTGNRSKAIATGLRNPYSLAIHPETGVPYTGDVGWKRYEELNGGWGRNFGWPCYSGAPGGSSIHPDYQVLDYCQGFVTDSPIIEDPIASWDRGEAGASIVADFYTGDVYPEQYHGQLFYGDFLQGWLRTIDVGATADRDAADGVSPALDAFASPAFATDLPPVSEWKMLDDGAMYYASITTGEIRRIRYVASADTSGEGATTGDTGSGSTVGGNADTGAEETDTSGTTSGGGESGGDIDNAGVSDTSDDTVTVGGGMLAWPGVLILLLGWSVMRGVRRR